MAVKKRRSSNIKPDDLEYNADYFIKKFKAIPNDKWTVNKLLDEDGRSCALGHCGERRIMGELAPTRESVALSNLFLDYLDTTVPNVNDFWSKRLSVWANASKTVRQGAKQRVMAALKAIKKEQDKL